MERRERAEEEDLEGLERTVGLEIRVGEATRLGEAGVKQVMGSSVTSIGCVAIWSSRRSTTGETVSSWPNSENWTVGMMMRKKRGATRARGPRK